MADAVIAVTLNATAAIEPIASPSAFLLKSMSNSPVLWVIQAALFSAPCVPNAAPPAWLTLQSAEVSTY